uniref:Uncharacterized protein n=1 Tax=Glossina palpalis gambiensis TaxID=67801 RepID=A0A1B0B3Z4_9MUSC
NSLATQQTLANDIITSNYVATDLHKDVFETVQDIIRNSDQTLNLSTSTEGGRIIFHAPYDKNRKSYFNGPTPINISKEKTNAKTIATTPEAYQRNLRIIRTRVKKTNESIDAVSDAKLREHKAETFDSSNSIGSNYKNDETAKEEEADEEDNSKNVTHVYSFDDICYIYMILYNLNLVVQRIH